MAMTLFQNDRRTPAMQARINQDLPACTSLRKLVGSNHPLSTLKAPGNKVQASSGTKETSTTTNNNTMKMYQVTTTGDICLSLAEATMTKQMEHHRHDNRLTTIEETQHAIQNTLHQYSQWQADMGHAIANIQQNQ